MHAELIMIEIYFYQEAETRVFDSFDIGSKYN